MPELISSQLERSDVDLQDGGAAVVDGDEATFDGFVESVGIVQPFAVSAERAGDIGELPLLALAA